MSRVFISYSHQDSDYAHRLRDALKQRGFDVWIDDQIDYGTRWTQVIQDHLDACAALVLIMTPRSLASGWVQNELARAQDKDKPIFPLRLEGDIWFAVQAIMCADVRDGQLPNERFYQSISEAVSQSAVIPCSRFDKVAV